MALACGKCGSKGLYRDDDIVNGEKYIACLMCGNRYPGGPIPVWAGGKTAQVNAGRDGVKRETADRAKPEIRRLQEKGAKIMGEDKRKKACKNCERIRFIISDGLCWLCTQAAKGLTGEARSAALAEIKVKIESGEVGIGKRRAKHQGKPSKPCKADAAPSVPARRLSRREKHAEYLRAHEITLGTQAPAKDDDQAVSRGFALGEARVPEGTPVICLDFGSRLDRKIFDALVAAAEQQRRTPEQQILWILQNEIEFEKNE